MEEFQKLLPSIIRAEWSAICKDLTDEDLLNLAYLSDTNIIFILIRIGLVEWRRRIRSFTEDECSKLISLIKQDKIAMMSVVEYERSLLTNSAIHDNYHTVYYIYNDVRGRRDELKRT